MPATQKKNAVNPPPASRRKRGTCSSAGCSRRHYRVGLCHKHWDLLTNNMEKLFLTLFDVVQALAKPGVPQLEEDQEDPFAGRLFRFLNHAAAHWNEDLRKINSAAKNRAA
jgi:hypothetical protein